MITLFRYKSASLSLYFRNVVSTYSNIVETCLKSFLFIQCREIYFTHGHFIYEQFIRSGSHRVQYKNRENTGEKVPVHATLPQNTNYPLQFDKPHEAALEWNNTGKAKPLLAVSLKNIPLCLSTLNDIYPDTPARRTALASFPLISVHNTFARVVDSTGRRWMNRPCT